MGLKLKLCEKQTRVAIALCQSNSGLQFDKKPTRYHFFNFLARCWIGRWLHPTAQKLQLCNRIRNFTDAFLMELHGGSNLVVL